MGTQNLTHKSVLILYTGGTIGMVETPDGFSPHGDFEARLRPLISSEQLQTLPSFTVQELTPALDSSNIQPSDWARMARTIAEVWQDHDGFVILHGTDTMVYSAAALSFLLRGMNKPVVLTGAQIPLLATGGDGMGSDGLGNVLNALKAACASRHEVMISFAGRFLRGNRTRKVHSTDLAAFDSPNFPHLSTAVPPLPATPLHFQAPDFTNGTTLFLPFYPGQSTDAIVHAMADPQLKGIVLASYGLGNPPDGNTRLMSALAEATAAGITVINTSQCQQGGINQGLYQTGRALSDMGVLSGHDMTPEAALTKLQVLIAMGLTDKQRRTALAQDWAGEITLPQDD